MIKRNAPVLILALILGIIALGVSVFSSIDKENARKARAESIKRGMVAAAQIRDAAYKNGLSLAKRGEYAKAKEILVSKDSYRPELMDSAQLLLINLNRVLAGQSDALALDAEDIAKLKAGAYNNGTISLPIAQAWYESELLKGVKRLPEMKAQQRAATVRAEREFKARQVATAQEERDQRVAAGLALRDKFLDKGLNIKVRVSGKNKDVIELEYVLFDEVWSYKMNQQGNIDELLDLGFKKVRLTDGYNYGVNWTRKQ